MISVTTIEPGKRYRIFVWPDETARARGSASPSASLRAELDAVLRELQTLGVVSVTLAPKAARRWWWSAIVTRMLGSLRPSMVAADVAKLAEVSERTAWRWLMGQTVPKADQLERLLCGVTGQNPAPFLLDMVYRQFGRASLLLTRARVTKGEANRALRWLEDEMAPLADVLTATVPVDRMGESKK